MPETCYQNALAHSSCSISTTIPPRFVISTGRHRQVLPTLDLTRAYSGPGRVPQLGADGFPAEFRGCAQTLRSSGNPPCARSTLLYAAHGLQEDFPSVGWLRMGVLATAQLGLSALSTPRSCQERSAGVTGVSECVTRPSFMGG